MKKKAESENGNEELKVEKQEEYTEANLNTEQPTKGQIVDTPEGSATKEIQISDERRANVRSPFHFLRNIKDEQIMYPVFLPKTSLVGSDGPWISSLSHIADVLRNQGISRAAPKYRATLFHCCKFTSSGKSNGFGTCRRSTIGGREPTWSMFKINTRCQ